MELSEDIAYNILSWLPAKAIYKFKTVSKSFSKISEEPTFLTKQAENSLARDDTCIFIQHDRYGTCISLRGITRRREVIVELLHPLPRNKPSSGISNDFLRSNLKSTRILSSSNGLILCKTIECPTELFVCNPITKSRFSIPNPINHRDPDDLIILLECYHGIDDYSLFHFEKQTDMKLPRYRCNVYKAKEGVWKTIEGGGFIMRGGRDLKFNFMPVFLNGIFYIISAGYPYYLLTYKVSYNLENGVTKMLPLPEQGDQKSYACCTRIFKWGKASNSTQSICLVKFDKLVFTIWLLKDYESVSWKKLLEVGVGAMGVKENFPLVKCYMVMNGDLLIFATEKKVYSYGLAGEKYMMLEEICKHSGSNPSLISYKDTLCPC